MYCVYPVDNDLVYDLNAIVYVQFDVIILHDHCIIHRHVFPNQIKLIFDVDHTVCVLLDGIKNWIDKLL